nr:structure-specific endonuclease subunit SLX4 isoform X2 [Parasteatoda tepidariorum]
MSMSHMKQYHLIDVILFKSLNTSDELNNASTSGSLRKKLTRFLSSASCSTTSKYFISNTNCTQNTVSTVFSSSDSSAFNSISNAKTEEMGSYLPEEISLVNSKFQVSPTKDDVEDDFLECKIEKKLRTAQTQKANVGTCICVVCRVDLTNLDLEKRTVHMNQCIDSQCSAGQDIDLMSSEAFILECPLCFKNFPSPEMRSAHIKKCGKSRGLSAQSVIQALQLQEKHFLERRALGLPLNKIKQLKGPKKPSVKKFTVEPRSAMQSDIQLAKALSLSLESNGSQISQNEMPHHRYEESSSIITLNPPTEFQIPGRVINNKRVKLSHTPLLLTRTEEERNKIMLDKVNAVIMPEVISEEISSIHQERTSQQVPLLWSLSGKAEENKTSYYVEQLLDWIAPSNVDPGSKLCNLSQIPGHHIYTQLPCDYTFSCESQKGDIKTSSDDNHSPSLMSGLRSLIGNSWMSDVAIHTASGIVIPAHKLILAIRCPILKKVFEDSANNEKHVLDMKNTSFDAALHFLNFIYTGSTEWKEDIIEELLEIAKKYDVKDLINILESDCGTLEMMSLQNTQMEEESRVKDCIITPETSSEKVTVISDDEMEATFHGTTKFSNSFQSSSLESATDNKKRVGIEETSEALSVCDDILNKLTNHSENSKYAFFTSEKNCESCSDFSSHDLAFSNRHEESKISPAIVGTQEDENSSSNDSCKVVHVSFMAQEESSCNYNENELISEHDKNSNKDKDQIISLDKKSSSDSFDQIVEKCDKMDETSKKIISSTKQELENNLCFSRTSETDNSVDTDVEIIKDSQRENLSQNFRHSAISFDNAFNSADSITKSLSTTDIKNYQLETSPVKNFDKSVEESPKHVSSRRNDESKLSLDEGVAIDSYPSYSECYNMTFDNRDISSPEIITCDSEDDLNIPINNSGYSDLKMSTKNVSSPMKNVKNHILDEKYQSSDDLNFPLNNSTFSESFKTVNSPKEESKNKGANDECHSDDNVVLLDSDEDVSANDIMYPLSPPDVGSDNTSYRHHKFSSSAKDCATTLHYQSPSVSGTSCVNSKINYPEVIIFDSDEEDEFNKTHKESPVKSYEENHKINPLLSCKSHKYESFDSPTKNKDENKSIFATIQNNKKPSQNISSCADSNILSGVPLSSSEMNSFRLKSQLNLSPESPWILKSKKSLDDFKTSSICLKKNKKLNHLIEVQENKGSVETKCEILQDSIPTSQNKVKRNCNQSGLSTPNSVLQQFKLTDSPITPFPDYQNMVTPEIKEALKKIGVKALPRKKAVAVLAHVYEETHPLIGKTSNHEGQMPASQMSQVSSKLSRSKQSKSNPVSQKRKRSDKKVDDKAKKPTAVISSPVKSQSEDSSFSSPDAKNTKKRKSDYLSLSSELSDCSQPESKEKVQLISDYILKNDMLYTQILTYTPINIVEFQTDLKDSGITIGLQKLMNYFDEQNLIISVHYFSPTEKRRI